MCTHNDCLTYCMRRCYAGKEKVSSNLLTQTEFGTARCFQRVLFLLYSKLVSVVAACVRLLLWNDAAPCGNEIILAVFPLKDYFTSRKKTKHVSECCCKYLRDRSQGRWLETNNEFIISGNIESCFDDWNIDSCTSISVVHLRTINHQPTFL